MSIIDGETAPPVYTWQQMPGTARDISVGANGDVWILGIGGGDPHRWNGATWDYMDAYAGINIDVGPDGQAWMVKEDGTIWRRSLDVQ